MPYTLADLVSDNFFFLKRSDVSFSSSGAILRVYRTGLWAPDRTKTGWVENEDLKPKTQKQRPPQNHL